MGCAVVSVGHWGVWPRLIGETDRPDLVWRLDCDLFGEVCGHFVGEMHFVGDFSHMLL
jgi:hypothetical protein